MDRPVAWMYIERRSTICLEFTVSRFADISLYSSSCGPVSKRKIKTRKDQRTVTGILVLLLSSSGSKVKNCNSVGTVAGFLPKMSIIPWIALSQAGS